MLRPILLVTVMLSSAALATEQPSKPDPHEPVPAKGGDPRICTFPYNPAMMMRVRTPSMVPVRIVFNEGANPDSVAGQFVAVMPDLTLVDRSKPAPPIPTNWSASNVGNTLMLQPLHNDIPSSVVFVTTRGTEKSNYVIELNVAPLPKPTEPAQSADDPQPKPDCVQVTYTYPAQIATDAADARARAQKAQTTGEINTSLTQARFNAPRNRHYDKMGAGCSVLTPSGWNWVSDDGNQTALLFLPHTPGSSIFARQNDEDKDEELITPVPINTKVGTLMILPETYRQIVLRRNDEVCTLRNNKYDPKGAQPGGGSGTISPDVVRSRRQEASK